MLVAVVTLLLAKTVYNFTTNITLTTVSPQKYVLLPELQPLFDKVGLPKVTESLHIIENDRMPNLESACMSVCVLLKHSGLIIYLRLMEGLVQTIPRFDPKHQDLSKCLRLNRHDLVNKSIGSSLNRCLSRR